MTEAYVSTPANAVSPLRVSWSAVFAGGAIALATYLVLSVLGTAIGAGAVDAMADGNPLRGLAPVRGCGCSSAPWFRSPPVPGLPAARRRAAVACMAC